MTETLSNVRNEDTDTNFKDEEYAFPIEALRQRYDALHPVIGSVALGNMAEVNIKE